MTVGAPIGRLPAIPSATDKTNDLRHDGSNPASGEQHDAQKKKRGIKGTPSS